MDGSTASMESEKCQMKMDGRGGCAHLGDKN